MYRAKDTFWAPDNRRIVKGDLVAPHDPVLEGREDLFEDVVIPQALAPEKKTAGRKSPAKKIAAKPPAREGEGGPQEDDSSDGGEQE
ncbi:hypothetical protein [Streptomyces sp. MNP-20]|uniref:hypothetical protein n=1 Tax=Streptomyces sp. MNP-20 TaxID=2721165 RepID=UPI001558247B|nr:hypothetical protein [Streptomyces sp. MNP-20]